MYNNVKSIYVCTHLKVKVIIGKLLLLSSLCIIIILLIDVLVLIPNCLLHFSDCNAF